MKIKWEWDADNLTTFLNLFFNVPSKSIEFTIIFYFIIKRTVVIKTFSEKGDNFN